MCPQTSIVKTLIIPKHEQLSYLCEKDKKGRESKTLERQRERVCAREGRYLQTEVA
jgi:hypothetical protein